VLNDLTVHDIDLALMFTNAIAGTVSGVRGRSAPGHPDFSLYGVTTITTPDSVMSLEANWLTPSASAVHGDYQMRLVGTEGVAELFWARRKLVLTTNTQQTHDVELPAGFRSAEKTLGALARGETPEITTHDSLLATRLALLAQRSADSGEPPVAWAAGTD
jgi:predicted dehydrogenase